MTLHQLIHKVRFDDVFSDILSLVPEAEDWRGQFILAFNTLLYIKPSGDSQSVIEVHEQDYLKEGVHDIWINSSANKSNIWENILACRIKRSSPLNRSDTNGTITNEMIIADLLWHLVAYGFPNETPALSGYILHNQRWPDSTRLEKIEEICSYIDLHQVTEITQRDICQYRNAENIAWIADMTPYSLPRNKASFDINCFLDDFIWFNNETKTILIISASEGNEREACKIEKFANNMLKNPTVAHRKPMLPDIEVMAIFITE